MYRHDNIVTSDTLFTTASRYLYRKCEIRQKRQKRQNKIDFNPRAEEGETKIRTR